jgi:hypothetical protein
VRRRLTLVALIVVIAIAAAGTLLWIAGVLRPVPRFEPGVVVASVRRGGALDLTVDVSGPAPIDRAGETVRQVARAIASGRMSERLTIMFDFRTGTAPLMRLVYDPGVIAAGAVFAGSGDHMLGLAGAGSRWPARSDPRVAAYCGRMETLAEPFCKRVTGG